MAQPVTRNRSSRRPLAIGFLVLALLLVVGGGLGVAQWKFGIFQFAQPGVPTQAVQLKGSPVVNIADCSAITTGYHVTVELNTAVIFDGPGLLNNVAIPEGTHVAIDTVQGHAVTVINYQNLMACHVLFGSSSTYITGNLAMDMASTGGKWIIYYDHGLLQGMLRALGVDMTTLTVRKLNQL